MYLRAVGRCFTQMNAYFLVMNGKRCNTCNLLDRPLSFWDSFKMAAFKPNDRFEHFHPTVKHLEPSKWAKQMLTYKQFFYTIAILSCQKKCSIKWVLKLAASYQINEWALSDRVLSVPEIIHLRFMFSPLSF